MTRVLRIIALNVVAFGIGASCLVHAQNAPSALPSDPSAAHEKLRFFEGAWTTTDSTPEQAFRETCAWLPEGRRHMVCRSQWKTASGPREGLSIFSYDPAARDYIYTGFRAGGAHVLMRGAEENGRWIFQSESGAGAERVRSRVTIEANQHGGFDFLREAASGDEPWKKHPKVVYMRLPR